MLSLLVSGLDGSAAADRREPPTRHRTRGQTLMFRSSQAVSHGISFGTAMAIAISWSVNKSILWAIVHGFFSWLYVIYYALIR